MTTPEIKVEADSEVQVTMKLDLNLLMQLLSAAAGLKMPSTVEHSLTRHRIEKKLKEEPKAKTFYFEHQLSRSSSYSNIDRHCRRCNEVKNLALKLLGMDDPELPKRLHVE